MAEDHYNRGNDLYKLQRFDEAIESYDRALAMRPDHAQALFKRGNALLTLNRRVEALASFDRSVALYPHNAVAWNNRAATLKDMGRFIEALASSDAAIAIDNKYAAAHNNRSAALNCLKRHAEALVSAETAVALKPGNAGAHNNRGAALHGLRRFDEAVACFERAIALNGSALGALHINLGSTLRELGKLPEAILNFEAAHRIDQSNPLAFGPLLHLAQRVCDWKRWSELFILLSAHGRLDEGEIGTLLLSMPVSARAQKQAARRHAASYHSPPHVPLRGTAGHERRKIRVGYLSCDFHYHATACLIAEVLELHDRNGFDIFAYSYGPDDRSELRARVRSGVDVFQDVMPLSFVDAARQINNDRIDILIDLKGYTSDARPEIVALRPAAIQVNWLGYPGTMGASFIDYIVADRFIVPEGFEQFYTEKIVRLPHSYQPNDRKRPIADVPSRLDCRLPVQNFVFCCFNQAYKILPDVFDCWMRILKAVPDGVLWLLQDHAATSLNLRREAEARGVSAERLVFAERKPLPEHLARYRIADLALDTFPCTSHTTASDALWAGCPLVTISGETFASRVAGSLLLAAGLPELITTSLNDYESLVIRIATDPNRRMSLRARLADARAHCALFDTPRFVTHLEAAYRAMWDRHASGLAPEDIDIAAVVGERGRMSSGATANAR